jgi:tRNA-splicing ligase RtcB
MDGDVMRIKTFGDVDQRSLEQLERCMTAGDAEFGVLCADHHPGYSQPIGGGIAYEGYVSPSGVGYDIGCIASGARVTTTDGWCRAVESVQPDDPIAALDAGRVRGVHPNLGAIARGARPARALRLVNDRRIALTADHRVMTDRGWVEAGSLAETDFVQCHPFIGLGVEQFELPPALIRTLAYTCGDGHLTRDGKRIAIYTTIDEDAAALATDFAELGFRAATRKRARGDSRTPEIAVHVNSVELHRRFAALGCPVGHKLWDRAALGWVLDAPDWVRAHFMSAFASAEMSTPRLVGGCLANAAVKQADGAAAAFITELLASLGFRCSLAPSANHHVIQILGGEDEQLRYLEQVGFCRAVQKRRAAAACASVAWQRRDLLARRESARAAALALYAGGNRIRAIVDEISTVHGVPRGFVHHALYTDRPLRRGSAARLKRSSFGEAAWVRVGDVTDAATRETWDIVTGDPAQSFLADGIVVHNCGNKAARTELIRADLDAIGGVGSIMSEITRRISFGVGVPAQERVDHPVLEKIRSADFAPQRKLAQLAESQLGTVGGGNHYVNLMEDEEGHIWVGVHFGSRGFGHKTATGFLALAEGLRFDDRAHESEMDSPPVLFENDSELGRSYVSAMQLAGEYAYAGRDTVVDKVLEILGAESTHEVHNHHNFAWREEHFGRECWVIRKGCTPARPGQEGFVGGSMGDESVILEGAEGPGAAESLYSTVHGAGRVMSRSQAAGRFRYRKQVVDGRTVRVQEQVKPGVVDWPAVQARLREQGIVLVGGGADEAPEVYKRLPDVLAAHAGSIRVKHTLKPLGVAMAGRDVHDPYKD